MPGQTRIRQGLLLVVMISTTSCASWRHKDVAAEAVHTDAAPAGTPQAQPAALDPQQQKIETLTSSLARATARIEELDAKISAMNDSLEGTRITVENLAGPQQNATPQTTPLGELADDVTSAAEPQTLKKKPSRKKEEVTAVSAAMSAEEAEKNSEAIQHFSRGVNLMRKGSTADAVLIFNQFVERYPEHALASSAEFHSGECYFQMGEYKLAIAEYEKMLRSYGNHPRVPSALVRLSQAYKAIGNETKSSEYRDLASANFAGNPSLDWPAPASRAAAPVVAKEKPAPQQKTATLDTAPMEISPPHDETHE